MVTWLHVPVVCLCPHWSQRDQEGCSIVNVVRKCKPIHAHTRRDKPRDGVRGFGWTLDYGIYLEETLLPGTWYLIVGGKNTRNPPVLFRQRKADAAGYSDQFFEDTRAHGVPSGVVVVRSDGDGETHGRKYEPSAYVQR